MTARRAGVALLVIVPLAALVFWVASNTSWVDFKVPMPLTGEARTNPSYAAQQFLERLGGRVSKDRVFVAPPADAIVVLSDWNWNLSPARRRGIEQWVESGGRLVVNSSVAGGDELEQWSGIALEYSDDPGILDRIEKARGTEALCSRLSQDPPVDAPANAPRAEPASLWVCNYNAYATLATDKKPAWLLREESFGVQAMRVRVGRGSVTWVNASPFGYRDIFDGDHAALLVTAADFRTGDEVHFLAESDYPSLLTLIWKNGAPVVVLLALLLAGLLWRGAIRLGPLAPAATSARRSLAEQIRGTGRFVVDRGDGEALHAACVRALDDAARKRIPGYLSLPVQERTAALAALAGVDAGSLAAAIYHPGTRRQELRSTIALLESARRRTLIEQTRPSHAS